MGADDAFPADERPFFAVRYKYNTTITQAGLFFTTDTLTVLSDKSYSSFSVVGDNTWRTAIVDMRKFDHKNWTGTITSFRFDPTNPSDTDSIYQVSRLGILSVGGGGATFSRCRRGRPRLFGADVFRARRSSGCWFPAVVCPMGSTRPTSCSSRRPSTIRPKQQSSGSVPKTRADDESVVPLCQTNGRGFTHFVAKKPGTVPPGQ